MKKKVIGAIALSAMVALQMPMTAFASVTDKVGLDVSSQTGTVVANDISVTGVGELEYGYGVKSCNQAKDVNVTAGNVSVEGNSTDAVMYGIGVIKDSAGGAVEITAKDIRAENTAGSCVGAYVGIILTNKTADKVEVNAANINVSANTDGAVYGILAQGNGTVNVTGLVKVTSDSSAGISAYKGANVTVGSIEALHGMEVVDQGTTVVVNGDVNASEVGIYYGGGAPTVVIEGTLTAKELLMATSKNIENSYFYELKMLDGSALDPEYNNVNYIIKTEGASEGIQLSGVKTTEEINGKTYDYANGGNTITVTVKEGYEINAPIATKNADGTYTILVPNGGGVSIEAIKKAIQQAEEEQKVTFTGNVGNPVTGGRWNMGPGGYWTYTTNAKFRDTWAYIGNPYANAGQAKEGWFYFDKNGVMLTGWQTINGKEYYFNEAHDGTYGMMFANTTTPDGKKVGADGAKID